MLSALHPSFPEEMFSKFVRFRPGSLGLKTPQNLLPSCLLISDIQFITSTTKYEFRIRYVRRRISRGPERMLLLGHH